MWYCSELATGFGRTGNFRAVEELSSWMVGQGVEALNREQIWI